MCGITGFYSQETEQELLHYLDKSIETLKKRGPNANGKWTSSCQKVGLGHTRLSIIDTSQSANQPMTSQKGNLIMVFNGEIFNYKTLRKELQSIGYHFDTESDSEVLLYLFDAYGTKCFEKINGFFGLAFYNTQSKILTLARDRFGIKPLYYTFQNKTLYFGSEMKALLAFKINKTLDTDALHLYFSLNYIPAPHTIFENVCKLKPGEYLEFDGKKLATSIYYTLSEVSAQLPKATSYAQAQSDLKTLLTQSVHDRLVADVPLGTFLSGGIDSSIITALASQELNSIDTFSVGFKDNRFFDERQYARLLAQKYKTNHHEIELTNEDLLQNLEELLDYTDEPFADSSALAVNALCKETKKQVTVCLSGDGADEVFGGYNKYMAEWKLQNLGFKEKLVKQALPLWNILPKSRNNPWTNTFRKLHKFALGANLDKKTRYWNWCCIGEENLINSLIINKKTVNFDSLKNQLTKDIQAVKGISDILLNDTKLVLPYDMLTKVDSMSMRNGLEVRVPFLDYRVVEFAQTLPDEFKINSKLKKRIVQDTFRDMLPAELYNRPKHGFEVPMLHWLRNELDARIKNQYLSQDRIQNQGIFDWKTVQKLIQKLHSTNPEDSHATVWALLVFQHWHFKYIGNE